MEAGALYDVNCCFRGTSCCSGGIIERIRVEGFVGLDSTGFGFEFKNVIVHPISQRRANEGIITNAFTIFRVRIEMFCI